MSTYVARRYRFHASHCAEGLPFPWSERHEHDYTVEVVYRGDGPIVIDTDLVDEAWKEWAWFCEDQHLNDTVGGPTTVEDLARRFFEALTSALEDEGPPHSVTVWEDDTRWGRYES